MPDTAPNPEGPITTVIGRAETYLAEVNVALAYAPGVPNREDHLLAVQDLIDALAALRDDL